MDLGVETHHWMQLSVIVRIPNRKGHTVYYIYIRNQAMSKIVGLIGLSSLGGATSLGEGKTLNSKPEKYCSRESVAH